MNGLEITAVRIVLADRATSDDLILGFATLEFNDVLVIRDLRLLEGRRRIFVAMPSKKIGDGCSQCRAKNHVLARYCNECGTRLANNRAAICDDGRAMLHADIVFPISRELRAEIERRVIEAYFDQVGRSEPIAGRIGGPREREAVSCSS